MTDRYLTLRVPRYSYGATLVELLIATALSVLLFGLVGMTLSQGFSAFRAARENVNAQEAGRVALERLATLVRRSAQTQIPPNTMVAAATKGEVLMVTRTSSDGSQMISSLSQDDDKLLEDNKLVGYDVQKVNFDLDSTTGAVMLSLVSSSKQNSVSLRTAASPRCADIAMAAQAPPAPK